MLGVAVAISGTAAMMLGHWCMCALQGVLKLETSLLSSGDIAHQFAGKHAQNYTCQDFSIHQVAMEDDQLAWQCSSWLSYLQHELF